MYKDHTRNASGYDHHIHFLICLAASAATSFSCVLLELSTEPDDATKYNTVAITDHIVNIPQNQPNITLALSAIVRI
jgi:hypothetical protein